jgi:hypothetical protein
MNQQMFRPLVGLLILAAMGGTGYGLIRPHVCRPALTVGAHFPKDSDLGSAVEAGVRLALCERDGRGGPYRISYAPWTESWCCKDYDNSNSSYAALGLREPSVHLPGFRHSRRLTDAVGNLVALLCPSPDGTLPPPAPQIEVPPSPVRVKPKRIVIKRQAPEEIAEGGLLVLARLKPPPADFIRRSGSADPFAWAAYRSCLRLLDALDRSTECGYDPFSDPEVATLGVYRVRAGRFEVLTVFP